MFAADFVATIENKYPRLEWSQSGKAHLENVVKLVNTRMSPTLDEEAYEKIESEFIHKLKYLNQYGGEGWHVKLNGDWSNSYNFEIIWHFRKNPMMNGLLQFNGVRAPFAAVVIGEITWWSIHT